MDTKIKTVGVFTLESGKLIVSDPCYDLDGILQITLDAVPGRWNVTVEQVDEGEWGIRNSSIIAIRDGYEPEDLFLVGNIGVDSAQAGFFDEVHYRVDEDNFYDACCRATRSDDGANGFGIIAFGALCVSGYGDGGYDVFAAVESGKVVAVRIVFIDHTKEEEEEDEY